MIATLLRQNKCFFWFYFLNIPICFSQAKYCNKDVINSFDSKKIPNEVCIRDGYVVSYVYDKKGSIDYNLDGRLDLALRVQKKNRLIGDSTLLYIYTHQLDSTFMLFKVYNNIFPVYFDSNLEVQTFKDKKLQNIFDCYGLPNPLLGFSFNKDEIRFSRIIANNESRSYKFKFSKTENDWIMIEKLYIIVGAPIVKESIPKNHKLSEFSFCLH